MVFNKISNMVSVISQAGQKGVAAKEGEEKKKLEKGKDGKSFAVDLTEAKALTQKLAGSKAGGVFKKPKQQDAQLKQKVKKAVHNNLVPVFEQFEDIEDEITEVLYEAAESDEKLKEQFQ